MSQFCRVNGIGSEAAIIIGHNDVAQGAKNYKDQTEYSYNYHVAFKVRYLLEKEGIEAVVVERMPGLLKDVYGDIVPKLVGMGIKNVYELHFNSFATPIWGGEVLFATNRGEQAANSFLERLYLENISTRKPKYAGRVDRGGYGLNVMRESGINNATLLEPCFANFKNEDTEWFFEDNGEKYCKLLTKFIKEDIRG